MQTTPQIETYLTSLDRALGPIPLSERAEIVTEIKSHLLEAREKSPTQSFDSLVAAFGEPEQVANRYLVERGIKPVKTFKDRAILKWAVIGMLGTLSLGVFTLGILVWKFSPLIELDGENEKLTLLGGMISMDGKEGKLVVGNTFMRQSQSARAFSGAKSLKAAQNTEIKVTFVNGKFDMITSADDSLRWDCKMADAKSEANINEAKNLMHFDLGNTQGAKCDFHIPKGMRVTLEGANGKLNANEPLFHLDVKMSNGKADIVLHPRQKYNFETHVVNGVVDTFPKSTDKGAFQMKIAMTNGKITASRD